MKTLILMRHSHAASDNPAYTDHDRPLTHEGRTLATTTSKLLTNWPIDEIICSSATRTMETADLLASELSSPLTPHTRKELYLAPPGAYSTAALSIPNISSECIAIIGHNPGIASLICTWANDSLPVSPATVAVFELAIDDWKELSNSSEVTKQLTGLISNGVRVR